MRQPPSRQGSVVGLVVVDVIRIQAGHVGYWYWSANSNRCPRYDTSYKDKPFITSLYMRYFSLLFKLFQKPIIWSICLLLCFSIILV